MDQSINDSLLPSDVRWALDDRPNTLHKRSARHKYHFISLLSFDHDQTAQPGLSDLQERAVWGSQCEIGAVGGTADLVGAHVSGESIEGPRALGMVGMMTDYFKINHLHRNQSSLSTCIIMYHGRCRYESVGVLLSVL